MKVLHTLFLLVLSNVALAAGAGDPFGKATSKLNELGQLLGGPIAIAVITLAVIIAGFGLILHKFTKETAIKIVVGGVIISSAAGIGGWLLS